MGGVLLRSESEAERRKWEKRLGLPEERLAEIVFNNPVAVLATVGQASADAVWAEVGRQLALGPGELAELRADFFAGDAFDVDLLAFIRGLRPRLKTGLISNAWPDVRAVTHLGLNETVFDLLLFSAEEGVKKPEPEIYLRALARLGVAPAEAVFVDDVWENVEGAQAVGMAGVQFKDSLAVREEIRKLIGD
jgi:putative hydrolase of the HAD superfamily